MRHLKKRWIVVAVAATVALVAGVVAGSYVLNTVKVWWCEENLCLLRYPLTYYAEDHGRYPPADEWCDLVVAEDGDAARWLVCDSRSQARSHYAINPNATPDSPKNVVLLFETEGGWNLSGGTELLTTDNHKGRGCNVLFCGGHVRFVKSEEISELRWKGD